MTINDAVIKRMAKGLTDYGFAGITVKQVRDWTDALVRGEDPEDVCAQFIKSWLTDAGLL